jgi:hypothetical protein
MSLDAAYQAALRPIVVAIDNAVSAKMKQPFGTYAEQAEKMAPLVLDGVLDNYFAWLHIDPADLTKPPIDIQYQRISNSSDGRPIAMVLLEIPAAQWPDAIREKGKHLLVPVGERSDT